MAGLPGRSVSLIGPLAYMRTFASPHPAALVNAWDQGSSTGVRVGGQSWNPDQTAFPLPEIS